jgi:predicted transcriptional regulator
MYSNNPHTLDELKHSICKTITSVEVSELKLVSNNILKRPEVCLRAKGGILSIYGDGEFF